MIHASDEAVLRLRERTLTWARPLLMGVVNANPDSFSDPGPRSLESVVARAVEVADAGATIVDLGAQSAITGRAPLDPVEEAKTVVPAVEAVRKARPDVIVSVDTFKPAVAEVALAAGAHLINDVSGLRDRAVARVCAAYGAGLVVMHTTVPPLVRRQDVHAQRRLAEEVAEFLARQVAAAVDEGVDPRSIVVDPGVDFAKTPAQSVELLNGIDRVVALGHPILLALSRKDFVGALTGRAPAARAAGTLGAVAALRHVPAQILRVHDVAAAQDFLAVLDTLSGRLPVDPSLRLPDHLRHEPDRRAAG